MLTLSLSDFCRVTHNITYSASVVSGMKNVYSRTNTRISAQTDKAEMSTYYIYYLLVLEALETKWLPWLINR